MNETPDEIDTPGNIRYQISKRILTKGRFPMLKSTKIAFIGGGNMSEALIKGLHGRQGAEACLACHDKVTDQETFRNGIHANTDTANCLSCHSIHSADKTASKLLAKAEPDLCAKCHPVQAHSFKDKPFALIGVNVAGERTSFITRRAGRAIVTPAGGDDVSGGPCHAGGRDALLGGCARRDNRAAADRAMALILGPPGVGLMGFYSLVADVARNIATMGLNTSGVRQIAEAVGSGENERVARTAATLRRIALLLGLGGGVLMLGLAWPMSMLSSGDSRHTGSLALLSLAVLFGTVSIGQRTTWRCSLPQKSSWRSFSVGVIRRT